MAIWIIYYSSFRNIKQRKRVIRRQEITPAMAQVTKPIAVKRPDLVTVVQKKEGHRFRCICGSSLPLDPIIQVAFSSIIENSYVLVSVD